MRRQATIHDKPLHQLNSTARRRIAPYLTATPTYHYGALDARTGCETWVKHENHQPVGAFKVRGGINLVSCLSADERAAGVIAASTGNHGSSVAFAARALGPLAAGGGIGLAFASCTNFGAMAARPAIAERLGLPVVTSNQAVLAAAVARLKALAG